MVPLRAGCGARVRIAAASRAALRMTEAPLELQRAVEQGKVSVCKTAFIRLPQSLFLAHTSAGIPPRFAGALHKLNKARRLQASRTPMRCIAGQAQSRGNDSNLPRKVREKPRGCRWLRPNFPLHQPIPDDSPRRCGTPPYRPPAPKSNFRFTPESGLLSDIPPCPKSAKPGSGGYKRRKEKAARRRPSEVIWGSLRGVQRHLVLPPIRHEADACEAEDHHRPRGRFGDGANAAK
jgi:hypothetical protein